MLQGNPSTGKLVPLCRRRKPHSKTGTPLGHGCPFLLWGAQNKGGAGIWCFALLTMSIPQFCSLAHKLGALRIHDHFSSSPCSK